MDWPFLHLYTCLWGKDRCGKAYFCGFPLKYSIIAYFEIYFWYVNCKFTCYVYATYVNKYSCFSFSYLETQNFPFLTH